MPYLFTHFTGEQPDGEQLYFAVSRDGLHWRDLNGGLPVLRSAIGTGGIRDPFPIRHALTGRFYIIATDLHIGSGTSWIESKTVGSRDLIVWQSDDLVNWSGPAAHTVGLPEAGNVWAPEAVFDGDRGEYFVFFASNVLYPGENARKQRIYGVFTKDFSSFSRPFLYIDRPEPVIDTTVIPDGGRYYRVTKSEVTKKLTLEGSNGLYSGFEPIPCPTLQDIWGLEGPEAYRLPDGSWCLIADQFASDGGYLPMVTCDFSSGRLQVLDPEEYDMGKTKKRHGGVLDISDAELETLLSRFG